MCDVYSYKCSVRSSVRQVLSQECREVHESCFQTVASHFSHRWYVQLSDRNGYLQFQSLNATFSFYPLQNTAHLQPKCLTTVSIEISALWHTRISKMLFRTAIPFPPQEKSRSVLTHKPVTLSFSWLEVLQRNCLGRKHKGLAPGTRPDIQLKLSGELLEDSNTTQPTNSPFYSVFSQAICLIETRLLQCFWICEKISSVQL